MGTLFCKDADDEKLKLGRMNYFGSASVKPKDGESGVSFRDASKEVFKSIRFSHAAAVKDTDDEFLDTSKLDMEYNIKFADQPSGTPLAGVDKLLDQQTTDHVKMIINCLVTCDTELSEENFLYKISQLGEQCHRLRQIVVGGVWRDHKDCG